VNSEIGDTFDAGATESAGVENAARTK